MPDRFIRESALTSESLARLSDFAERLFWRLTTIADDYGRFAANPAVVAGRTMPLVAGATAKRIDAGLAELETEGAIQRYSVDGKPYAYFPGWSKHQLTRAKYSKFPDPPSSADICLQVPTDDSHSDKVCARPNSYSHSNPDPVSSSPDLNPLDPNRSLETEPKPKPKRETAWPADLALTDAMRTFATERGIAPEAEFEAWRDDCQAHGRRYVDWEGAWRTRIRNAPKFAGRPQLALARGRPVAETPMEIAKRLVREAEDRERAAGNAE